MCAPQTGSNITVFESDRSVLIGNLEVRVNKKRERHKQFKTLALLTLLCEVTQSRGGKPIAPAPSFTPTEASAGKSVTGFGLTHLITQQDDYTRKVSWQETQRYVTLTISLNRAVHESKLRN